LDPVNNTIKSMHGAAEAQENLRQICIREEQSGKYWDYVRCYIEARQFGRLPEIGLSGRG